MCNDNSFSQRETRNWKLRIQHFATTERQEVEKMLLKLTTFDSDCVYLTRLFTYDRRTVELKWERTGIFETQQHYVDVHSVNACS